ncbi:MAG: radical SAM protein [Deltaproteobacteria bacterium]|nr:radical SAM protein [Deltaproteobacteria bacterium]MBZ0219472.1 radical SAM protein [Deltaproteobacteria bacterium]
MKVAISYPPLGDGSRVPLLSQNRQFQWFRNPTYIYPMVPAYAATLLRKEGFGVFWDDAIAEGLSFDEWLARIRKKRPDVIAFETKTPVVKRHWAIINLLKAEASRSSWDLKTVLMGDHVTALPEESLRNSLVDFVIAGGDYDFQLLSLAKALAASSRELAGLEAGVWFRENGRFINSGNAVKRRDLDSLPFIDRELTRWELYSSKNGNFKKKPGTYTMAGRDCWWGRCSFCSWTTMYPGRDFRSVSPERLLDEVGMLIGKYGVREIFDDSGTFPACEWLESFCKGMIERGYGRDVSFGCNMRINALGRSEYKLMAKAGFRFVLFGLESMNRATLSRLDKGLRPEQIARGFRMAKEAGLEPHVTAMVGYPWETKEDAEETIAFAREMFRKGYIDSLQATIVVPYPGTPLFEEARKNGWLTTEDWDRYDMSGSVWRSPLSDEDARTLTRGLYKAALSPAFLARKVMGIRSIDDLKFLVNAGFKLLGHLSDFKARPKGLGKDAAT